jgi:biopolymer transport protein ExbD
VIAADKALPYEQVNGLLDRVKGAGSKKIALAATKP